MFKRSFGLLTFMVTVLSLISCTTANNRPLSVRFSTDSSTLVFEDIDPVGMGQLRQGLLADSSIATLVKVQEKNIENDTEQNVHGLFSVTDSSLVFKPDRAFAAGKTYLVISYLNARFASPEMLLKGKMDHQLKPQQFLLEYK